MAAPTTASEAFDTVTAYLGWDHARIDAGLAAVSASVREGRFDHAARDYDRFERDLLRHERIEEELLFPVFEARSGIVGGPTIVMLDEHRQVRSALALMRRALSGGDDGGYADALRFLDSVLRDHNAREEHILFPAVDHLLTAAERATFVARQQRE